MEGILLTSNSAPVNAVHCFYAATMWLILSNAICHLQALSLEKEVTKDSIHPFGIHAPFQGCWGLEYIPAAIEREAGNTLDGSPVHHRSNRFQAF